MNISKETIVVVIIMAVLYYVILQMAIDEAEEFGITIFDDIFGGNAEEETTESFCAGPGCVRHGRRRRFYNKYYDPYYGTRHSQSWLGPWGYFWNYLPCIDTVSGGTFCW